MGLGYNIDAQTTALFATDETEQAEDTVFLEKGVLLNGGTSCVISSLAD